METKYTDENPNPELKDSYELRREFNKYTGQSEFVGKSEECSWSYAIWLEILVLKYRKEEKNQLTKIQVKGCKWTWMELNRCYVTDCDQFYKSNPSLPKLLDVNVKIKFCQYCGGRIEE